MITVLSLTSIDIQSGLGDFSLDAGVTYLDNEPLAAVRAIPLYRERYFLFTGAKGPFRGRSSVSWREAAETPLCLLADVPPVLAPTSRGRGGRARLWRRTR